MSVEKEPITEKEFDKLLQAATRYSDEARLIILIFRYTGMHVSILAEPVKYNLRVEDEHIVWNRTKKKGKEAHTSVLIPDVLKDWNLKKFFEELRRRRKQKKRRRISRRYFYDVLKMCGERAGLASISPMTLRHTLGIWMLNNGYTPNDVQKTLNVSDSVLKIYIRHSSKTLDEKMRRLKW